MYGAPVHFRPLEREESRDESLQGGLAFIDLFHGTLFRPLTMEHVQVQLKVGEKFCDCRSPIERFLDPLSVSHEKMPSPCCLQMTKHSSSTDFVILAFICVTLPMSARCNLVRPISSQIELQETGSFDGASRLPDMTRSRRMINDL